MKQSIFHFVSSNLTSLYFPFYSANPLPRPKTKMVA